MANVLDQDRQRSYTRTGNYNSPDPERERYSGRHLYPVNVLASGAG